MTLDARFLSIPIAHRGLHGPGIPENSLDAVRAARQAGFGIEVDIQPSADGVPMVFHDYELTRLTGTADHIRDVSAKDLAKLRLLGTDAPIPTLAEVLDAAGEAPVLIELKDQDGALGERVGPLEKAVADVLRGYGGPVAVMSFNPHSVHALARHLPGVPRGLTTCAFDDWDGLEAEASARLRTIPDYHTAKASFISHHAVDLDRPRVSELKAAGAAILCWTIRSAEEERAARRFADNITFEGYLPG